MNLMLMASCNDADDFKTNGYDSKIWVSNWCDSSKSIFSKIDEQTVLELFDVNPEKLKEWLAKPSTQQIFKEHNFVPTRYTFEPLNI